MVAHSLPMSRMAPRPWWPYLTFMIAHPHPASFTAHPWAHTFVKPFTAHSFLTHPQPIHSPIPAWPIYGGPSIPCATVVLYRTFIASLPKQLSSLCVLLQPTEGTTTPSPPQSPQIGWGGGGGLCGGRQGDRGGYR